MGKSPSDMKLFSETSSSDKKAEKNSIQSNKIEMQKEAVKTEQASDKESAQPPTSYEVEPNSNTQSPYDRGMIKNSMAKAVIGSKIIFKGELSGDEDLLIQGQVEGTVKLNGNNLTIGKLGKVKADLSAKSIIIDGTVEGDIVADEQIIINASSVITGNVIANRVTLEDGAKFRGSIEMDIDN